MRIRRRARIRRLVIGAASLTLILTSSACGSPDDTRPTAIDVHRRMESVLRKGNTGAFSQRMVSIRDGGSVTIHETGSYNLADESWSIQLRYSSLPVELLQPMPRLERLGTDIIYTGHRVYLSRPGWPKHRRGLWVVEAPTAGSPASPSTRPGRPIRSFFPTALSTMTPVAVTPNGPGWTLRGQIGVDIALEALGVDVAALRPDKAGSGPTGRAEVTVELGADFAPQQVRVDGNTVSIRAGLPESVVKDLVFMRTTTVLSALGSAPPIIAPNEAGRTPQSPSRPLDTWTTTA